MAFQRDMAQSKRRHIKTERMQEFIRTQGEQNSPTKKLKCPEENCNKIFTSAPGLKYHLQTHTVKDPQFNCRRCHKIFKSANGLKYHREKTWCDDSDMDVIDIQDMQAKADLCSNAPQVELAKLSAHKNSSVTFPLLRHIPKALTFTPSELIDSGMDKLTELAIIATGPQSPLLQKPKPPWETKPSGCVRLLELDNIDDGHLPSTDCVNCKSSYAEGDFKNESIPFFNGSDSRVSTSSPLCVSPDDTERLGTWSHSWPTAVWQCFIKGTQIKMIDTDNNEVNHPWLLAEDIALKEQLAQQASINLVVFRYASDGLHIDEIWDRPNPKDQSQIEIQFSSSIPGQQNLLAICQRNHPFFVKNKGWSSCYPKETVVQYGIPCSVLCVGDICLPPSHSDAASSEEIFKGLEEFDFTPEDKSAVFALSSMKQHKKDSDQSPPPGSGHASTLMYNKAQFLVKPKRPMNAFMLFAKDFRMDITSKFPKRDNRAISVILGENWKTLSVEKRLVYEKQARLLAEEQKRMHPDCWKRKK